jgi:hypothetical protein
MHRTPLLVHAADGKQVFWADGPLDRGVDGRAMREIGDEQGAQGCRDRSRPITAVNSRAVQVPGVESKRL